MINLKVKFFHQEWDNHQGGSGTIITREKYFHIEETSSISEVRSLVIEKLNHQNYKDDWFKSHFTGRGIISIEII